ncbi:hypothetical protein M409DRAFT_21397 [Zasmidium cellare ATCC 36951]|uniref:Uncharacterized protein n=1 Tax=Zasmidium cellare ATCC 36951 TaxID=1080233 RepID=A0A6A6CNF6_ZASCE|nr:uncharacterized protein M409DRAFT_21397 [Zasmidium cellare ATCC 36951]KAF2168654.1 hypothetical protein M409DRAFT_21397 [Zasmidium cellare ATCC 36951]
MTGQKELKILTPSGQLGQGFPHDLFWTTLEQGVDAIIMDGGSTDSGPGRLAQGKTNVPVNRLERDLQALVKACHLYKVLLLVGTAGGDGENAFVNLCIDIIRQTIKSCGYRSMKVIGIYSEIDKEYVREKMRDGLVGGCGSAVPELTENDIDTSTRIVAQMGLEPYLKAMQENPSFDIIIGGRAYDPAPCAAYCLYRGFTDLGVSYAMGKILECGGLCSVPKSRSAMAVVRQDSFDVTPLDPNSKCTPTSVAAHFLYEKARPDILHGPGGHLDLTQTSYKQVGERTTRVTGAKFLPEPEGEYTIKLEGARSNGFQTIFLGALRDPIVISQIDEWIKWIEAAVRTQFPQEFDLKVHTYGVNVATAGNFAWPFTPAEIPMGPLSEFCIYHIVHKADPVGLFPFKLYECAGENTFKGAPAGNGHSNTKPPARLRPALKLTTKYPLKPSPPPNTCYLGDIASVVRSKNASPYELTFDVMFSDPTVYERVKATGILSEETIMKLYGISKKDVVATLYWDPAMAFKATIKRAVVSGGFAESDTHGSQQHVPLLFLRLPWGRE